MNNLINQLVLMAVIFLLGGRALAQPAMSSPTVTDITNTSATLGGTIAGAGITARGTAWKISSPVVATDNPLAEGGTFAGTYTHSRTSLPPATQIFFVAFGTDAVGTAISAESSFYTLSNPASGQPATFNSVAISNSQINLTWTSVTASGFLIYRRAGGTAPNVSADLVNGTAPLATLTDGSTLVNTAAGAATSFNNTTGLSAGTQYSYTIVPFGYNGANSQTYNYLTTSAKITNAFTLSNPPSGQPASFTATTFSNSQINLAWPSVTSNGFLIYRRNGGTAPDVSALSNATAPPALLADGSTLVFTAAGAATSYSNTGLSSGTQYSYTLVPFGYNGSDATTYNYLKAGAKTASATTYNATSTITLNGGTTASIDYASYQTAGGPLTTGGSANSVTLAQFRVNDLGGDVVATSLTSVTINISNFSNISEIAIFDGGGTNRGQQTVTGPNVTFGGLSTIVASDGGTANFRIRATFNSTVVDQQIINLTITNVTSTGSGFASFGATTSASGDNMIQVTAVQLLFTPSTLVSAPRNTNFGPLTVSAVDLNGNTQKSRSNTVTLSIFNGSGTLNPGAQSLTPNLVNGTFTWTNLSINQAGNKVLRATYSGLVNVSVSITISSAGVSVTPGNVVQMCYNGDYQTISTITITESDPSDFTLGNSQSISFILPTGFIFNTSVTTAPTITGNEINGITNLSYSGNNTVLFSYNISGTSNSTLDKIEINGLQVKYTGTTPTTGNLLRFGGTAIQAGNASSDAKNYCTLTAANSATVVDFSVQELTGDPVVVPTTTQFGSTSKTVKLIGSPAGGVFSGSAVVFAAGTYTFSPSTVGVGSYQITYTYTETTGQHCQISVTKTFTVVANFITNLLNQYCSNGAASTGLSVPQATINTFLSSYGFAANTFNLKEFVYWEPTTGAFTTINGTNTTFDPANPQFAYSINNYGAVWVGARYKDAVFGIALPDGPNNYPYIQYAYVRVFKAPPLAFNLPSSACVNATAIDLVSLVTPTPTTPATDKFLAASGVTNPSNNVWTFNPSNVPNANTSPQTVSITYQYTDPNPSNGSCSNTITKSITVYPIPTAPPLADTNSPLNLCQGSTPSPLTATPVVGTTYSWYSNAALGAGNLLQQGDNFTPVSPNTYFNNTIVSDYQFYLTRTLYASVGFSGCESPASTVVVSVKAAPKVGFDPSFTITSAGTAVCAGGANNIVDLSGAATGATVGAPATTASWSTTGTGNFLNSSNNVLSSPFTLNTAVKYQPSLADQSAGVVIIKLTTDTPTPPCAAAVATYTATINPVPAAVKFTNPADNLVVGGVVEYCDNTIDSKLVAVGAGTGTITYYSNPGLSNVLFSGPDPATYFYNFNPSTSRDVDFYVTQTVNNCQSQPATLKVLLHPVPVPVYSLANFCIDSAIPQAPTQFTDQTPGLSGPSAPYSPYSYKWDFGDNTVSAENSQQNPSHAYKNIGTYNTQLTVTTNKGCSATSPVKIQEIGPIPQTDFTFKQLCKDDNTEFAYTAGSQFDNSSNGRTVTGWAWDFGDVSNNTSSASNPIHKFTNAGLFSTSLALTSGLGCQNTKIKEVYILPKIKFDNANNFTYSESFENNNNGPNNGAWATEVFLVNANSNPNTSWYLTEPDGGRLNAASDGTKAWVAGLNGINKTYYQSETSVLNGPCLDISGLQKPVLSFDYLVDTWAKNDGVYVQYSIDNGATWNTYGKKGKGVNWYNNDFIAGLSGSGNIGQAVGQEGWDGQGSMPGWSTGRYSLSSLGSNTIRIRFFFGTGGNIDGAYLPNYHNGFGLDNVVIQNSNRTVLAENFTNNTPPNSSTVNDEFKNFKGSAVPLSLIKLEYHTNFGGADSEYDLNPADPQARAVFYGVTSSFKGFIDSYSQGQIATGPINNPTWAEDYFDQRSLVPSPLIINLTSSAISSDEIQINAAIKILGVALPPGSVSSTRSRYSVHMAIVENKNGQLIVRRLLPDASGKSLTNIAANELDDFSYIWKSSEPINPANLSAICFVQDLETKDVLQASIAPLPVVLVTGIENRFAEQINIYPNPASREFRIELPYLVKNDVSLHMIDQVGRRQETGVIPAGSNFTTVNVENLSGGIYILEIGSATTGIQRKKIMVVMKN